MLAMKLNKKVESVATSSLTWKRCSSFIFQNQKSKECWETSLFSWFTYKGFSNYMQVNRYKQLFPFIYLSFSLITIFSPVAGVLTDVRFSRYKAILCSSCSSLIALIVISIFAAIYRELQLVHVLHGELLYKISSCLLAIPIELCS